MTIVTDCIARNLHYIDQRSDIVITPWQAFSIVMNATYEKTGLTVVRGKF